MVEQCRKRDDLMKINKQVSYAIKWLVSQNNTTEQIAEELKLTVDQVSQFLEKNSTPKTSELAVKSSKIKPKDLMIRHTRDKKNNSVAIMTKEASEVNDHLKNKSLSSTPNRNADCIFRPNENQ